jgi:hypothetical protein
MSDTNGAAVSVGQPTEQDLLQSFGETQKLYGAISDGDLESLLNQIGEGLKADDATNFEKLNIARKYGPLLIELKAMVPHGHFKLVLKERFPRVSYSKCNRWMVIARHEAEVVEALVAYPDVAWGPKKMIDFLTKEWRPDIDHPEDDEEDCWGCVSDDPNQESPIPVIGLKVLNADSDGEDLTDEDDGEFDDRSKWEKVTEAAESEARLIGKEPVIPTNVGTVIVTVFSEDDHEVIEVALAEWQPRTVPVLGRKGVTNLTATVSPEAIPELLMKLAKTLKKALPSQLKVSIEL